MTARDTSKDGWTIKIASKDEAGKQLVLNQYKPFRLKALRLDPASFGSTLAREQAFADDVWIARLMDPLNRLFLAIDNATQEILSTAFLRRFPDSMVSSGSILESPVIIFGIYGVWTLPTARRQGIARHLLEEVIRLTRNIARIGDRDCRLEVEVFKHNEGAAKLYREAGFEENEAEEGDMRKLTLLLPGPEEAAAGVAQKNGE